MVGAICGAEHAARACRAGAPIAGASPARFIGAAATRAPVVLFADTFNRYFEPENIAAALAVLAAGGYGVHLPKPADAAAPLCCGRTFLAVGLVDEARREAERCVATLAPFVGRGIPVVGLEPSCLIGFRDEIPALIKSEDARLLAADALLLEEFIAREAAAGTLKLALKPVAKRALLHGHCHQKSFAAMAAVESTLKLDPGASGRDNRDRAAAAWPAPSATAPTPSTSRSRWPSSRCFPPCARPSADTLVVADGTSCRHQIKDGTGREALHVARVLAMSLASGTGSEARSEAG